MCAAGSQAAYSIPGMMSKASLIAGTHSPSFIWPPPGPWPSSLGSSPAGTASKSVHCLWSRAQPPAWTKDHHAAGWSSPVHRWVQVCVCVRVSAIVGVHFFVFAEHVKEHTMVFGASAGRSTSTDYRA